MKWILITKSESGDMYCYGIESAKDLNQKEIQKFLKENAYDRDEDQVYEYQEMLILLPNVDFLKFPA